MPEPQPERPSEEALVGEGVTAGIVRVGDTVRRPVRPFTATIQAFLKALHDNGFPAAPVPLGYDDQGREMVSYVDGDVPTEPLPAWATTDQVLEDLARLIRAEHDAAAAWAPPADAVWGGIPGTRSGPAVARPELVAHMDYCPGNVVFRAGRPVALIDFDLARPTSRVRDVVNALVYWAPLRDPVDRPAQLASADVPARVRRFADAYGLTGDQRREVGPCIQSVMDAQIGRAEAAAAADPVFARAWAQVGRERMPRAQAWFAAHRDRIEAALLA